MAKKTQSAKATKQGKPKAQPARENGGPSPVQQTPTSEASTGRPQVAKVNPKPRKGDAQARPGKKKAKMSGLDAAAAVLAAAGKPLKCQEVVDQVFAKGLWATSGKTPAATIHAAMIREIRDKGAKSRFKKHGRGTFVATGK